MTKPVAPKDVTWVETLIGKMHDNPPKESQWRYKVWLPDWLAEWDVFAIWEYERFTSMETHLEKGDVLIDIGAENGWQSMIYAQFVGPENMVLIEPSTHFWSNIKHTWIRNFAGVKPLNCYAGLLGDKTTIRSVLKNGVWPAHSDDDLDGVTEYKYIHEHGFETPQMTLDDYIDATGIVPNALTMDVEGAEMLILKGAHRTLLKYDLKVWISIHDELGERDYGVEKDAVIEFMKSLGYVGEYLATDHEAHWYFRKVAK